MEDEAEAEGGEPEEGAVVEAPAVLTDGTTGAYSMSQPPVSEDEEASIHDGDILLEGEKENDNVVAADEAEARLAAAAAPARAAAAPAAAAAGP